MDNVTVATTTTSPLQARPESSHNRTARRRGTVFIEPAKQDNLVSTLDRTFSKLPLVGSFFKMTKPKSSRKVGSNKFVSAKTGMFSWAIVYELFSLRFMQYKTLFGDESADLRDSFNNQQTSVGLVSALLFTVFVSFVQNNAGDEFNRTISQTFEVSCWVIATTCSLAATAISVLLMIALSETDGPEDSNHFLRLLGEYTYGIGPISPVFFLIVSVIFALVALVPYFILQFGLTCTLLCAVSVVFVAAVSGFFIIQTVATLKVAKETDAIIESAYVVVDLNFTQLAAEFKNFVSYYTGEEYNSDTSLFKLAAEYNEDSFLEYLRTMRSLPNEEVTVANNTNDGDIDGSRNINFVTPGSLSKLSLLSERRAKAFFNAFMEANTFEKTSIDNFVPSRN